VTDIRHTNIKTSFVSAIKRTHFDNYPSDEWAGKSEARTVYSDCMVHMDYALDQLVKKLEETSELENTMILLTSDKLSNRGDGTEGQNRSCSITWAAKVEKFQLREKCFFLAFPLL